MISNIITSDTAASRHEIKPMSCTAAVIKGAPHDKNKAKNGVWGLPCVTSARKGQEIPNSADREGGQKIHKVCERHIWKPLMGTSPSSPSSDVLMISHDIYPRCAQKGALDQSDEGQAARLSMKIEPAPELNNLI